jgi:hypothetical protein
MLADAVTDERTRGSNVAVLLAVFGVLALIALVAGGVAAYKRMAARSRSTKVALARPTASKLAVARDILAERSDAGRRGNLFVHLDPRRPGVVVPPHLAGEPRLVLEVGYDMPVPIPDLVVSKAGIGGTLSFNREPFSCWLPWDAVFALVGDDGLGQVWEDDVPAEVAAERDGGVAP